MTQPHGLSWADIAAILSTITYKPGWAFLLLSDDADRPYIQVQVSAEASEARSPFQSGVHPWRGGKVYLSYHMCRQEIVGAAFGAIRAAEEHEMREWFRYRGRSIFNPHLDPEALHGIATFKNMSIRRDAMMMSEGPAT